ncbi:hypothetical protein QQF64_015679, partial [Cirrhinus molitorella]
VNHCCLPDIAEEILITLSLIIVKRSHDQMLSGVFFPFERCQDENKGFCIPEVSLMNVTLQQELVWMNLCLLLQCQQADVSGEQEVHVKLVSPQAFDSSDRH